MKAGTKTKHPDSHYVSHSDETPVGQAVPVDKNHAEVVAAHGAVNAGVTKSQFVRKHEQAEGEPELGGEGQRTTKASRVTLGRHITSAAGLEVASRRHKHVKTVRSSREKENFGSK